MKDPDTEYRDVSILRYFYYISVFLLILSSILSYFFPYLWVTALLQSPPILFFAGIGCLVFGAGKFTEGAADIARIMRIPEFLVGTTIVAIGTSLPELGSSIMSVYLGHPDIVLGNVVGSNIANICLIIGLSGLIKGINVEWNLLLADIPFLLVTAITFLFVSLDGVITRLEGIILVLMYVAYVHNLMTLKDEHNVVFTKKGIKIPLILVAVGSYLVYLGAENTVIGARAIGETLGRTIGLSDAVLDTIIGFTLIAIGTSLPELVTSIVAERTGHGEMIIGDVIGSNNFNILCVIGIVAIMSPISVSEIMKMFFIPIMLVVSILIVVMLIDKKITRFEAALLFLLYIVILINIYGYGTTPSAIQ